MIRSSTYGLLLAAAALLFGSCRDFSFNSFVKGEVLATVGETTLYQEDVQNLFNGDLSPQDSLKLLNSYVDQWVKQQLKILHAEISSPEEEQRIERMVENYRNSLLIYEFEKNYIDRHLDTMITASEISQYYDAHFEAFRLTVPLVKAVVVRFPTGTRQEGQMRIMGATGTRERLQDLIDMAVKNNFYYQEYAEWTELSEITAQLPRLSEQEQARLLGASPLFEVTQGDVRYFVVLTGILKAGSPTPLERAAETIRTLILNQRRQDLLRRMEEELLRRALQQNEVILWIDTLQNLNEQAIEE
ncbi:MAG: hypothetical protein LUD68_08035 [Rikenellaceae bacterium]|nr:hypothetical protein [Rikenellaceae bacterium]